MGISRRSFVRGLGAAGLAAASPTLWFRPDVLASEPPEQLHLQFAKDASSQVVASWATPGSVVVALCGPSTRHRSSSFGRCSTS